MALSKNLKPKLLLRGCVAAAAISSLLFLSACGDDSSSSKGVEFDGIPDIKVEILDDLPFCIDKYEGSSAYVKDETTIYVCENGDWIVYEVEEASEVVPGVIGEFTDSRDGQTYKTVTVGGQTWMAENLNYKAEHSGCGGGNGSTKEGNCSKYGRLYTWAAAVGKQDSVCGYGSECSLPSGIIQGVCPDGWHLPSKEEFVSLFVVAGGRSMAGKTLVSEKIGGTDEVGFSAFSAGYGATGHYYSPDSSAYFWSATEYDETRAYYMGLFDAEDAVIRKYGKYFRFSVRCLKD